MQKYQSPALEKGLDILEHLSLQNVPKSQTEIAIGLNRNPNEIYRMLICLEERGYIIKDQVSGKYSLSLKLYHLSHQHSSVNKLRSAASYPMQELSEYSKQSCHFAILFKSKVLVIAQTQSSEPISISIEDGALFPIYKTTSGRIILSQLSREDQLFHLNKDDAFLRLSKGQKNKYLSEIDDIVRNRYDIRKSETTDGVYDIAVALGIPEIEIIGSLAVAFLSSQTQESVNYDKILAKALETVEKIFKNLGIKN